MVKALDYKWKDSNSSPNTDKAVVWVPSVQSLFFNPNYLKGLLWKKMRRGNAIYAALSS